jgi:hypothetical protein
MIMSRSRAPSGEGMSRCEGKSGQRWSEVVDVGLGTSAIRSRMYTALVPLSYSDFGLQRN